MSAPDRLERAVRALLQPPAEPFWAPSPPPEPLDPALAELLPSLPPGEWEGELRLALALRRNGPLRQAALRAALARAGLPDLLERQLGRDWSGFRLRLLLAAWRAERVDLPPLDLEGRAERSLQAALAYLDPQARLPVEAWEVPRLSQPPEVGEGVVFPAAVIAEALLAAGCDPAPLIRLIRERRGPLGWHYWNPEHLPPDSDTLGQVLQVLVPALSRRDLERLAYGPAAMAAAQMEADGAVPTFLADGAAWSREVADEIWPIRHCPAVLANLLTGLHLLDPDRYGETVRRGAGWILEWARRTGSLEGPSYAPPYGRYAASRLLARLQLGDLAGVREAVLSEQRWDGSWGSPQATALELNTLLTLQERGGAVDAAALYLTETQQVTGCWRSEPLWLTPGPGVYPTCYYESVPVTTALCIRALARWQAARRS